MDFTKDTSECSSSVGKSFSQDSLNARILFKACRDAESKSLISITETSSSKSFDNQVDEQEIQKQLKFLNAYLDSSDINLICQQDKRHFSLQNEIVSITSDRKFEALKTQIVDTECQMNTKMERGYNELRRLVMKRIDAITLKQSTFISEISKRIDILEQQTKKIVKENEQASRESSTCFEFKMSSFEKELSDIRSILGIEHKMNSLSVDIADKNKSDNESDNEDDKENI
ncbi:unnamed protein product [Meloidogyne enterolobii]|uniref:Uncharacterized protein n=1 Tax=Meloidogyne enterolobii TaxID=390850 RepID=A0ACB0Y348_MELEN